MGASAGLRGLVDMTGVVLTFLLTAIVALALIAKRMRVPYPIVFVVGGVVIALLPRTPDLTLRPDLVFLLFLPPLIFGDAWTTDFRSFMRYLQPIVLLSTGLVAFTSICVAYVAHALIGFPLPLGFVLGAILSPTDAVATEAIAEEVGMSRRLAAVINGESLVNDATGLVIYKFAVAAVVTGAFSLVAAVTQFVWVTVAGLALGVGIAWAIARLMIALRKQGLSDEVIAVAISLVTPFALYVPADALGASGVLAAMSGGIYLSRKSFDIFSADERLAVRSIWSFLFFVFNGGAFILIGLQLPTIMRTLRVEAYGLATILGWALAMSLVVIAVRFLWVFPVSRLRRALIPRLVAREGPAPRWSHMTVLAAAGMRGIVSLAAALALPEAVASGAPFPARDLVLFVTFVVILVTLVGEGLLLPVLIRALGVGETESDDDLIALARVRTAEAALERLCSLEQAFSSVAEWEIASVVRAEYEQRLTHERSHLDAGASGDGDAHVHRIERTLRMEVSTAERYALVQLRRHGAITDEVYRRIELDIDLTESRLHR